METKAKFLTTKQMTLIALIILPISMGLIGLVMKKSQKFFRSQQEYLGHING